MAVLFAYVGEDVFVNGSLTDAVDRGVRRAYVDGALRLSVVRDPLYDRTNTNDNTPAILHIRPVKGDTLRLVALPKGFGSENMSALRMFTPAATEDDIVRFVVETVEKAGSNPRPSRSVSASAAILSSAPLLPRSALSVRWTIRIPIRAMRHSRAVFFARSIARASDRRAFTVIPPHLRSRLPPPPRILRACPSPSTSTAT